MLKITPCQRTSDFKRFEEVAEDLHGMDPAFVPPFPGSISKYLTKKSAFLRRHGEIQAFIALRDGRPAGRIAAIINRTHNEYYGDKTGFFGFFECEDDPETATALLDTAARVLRERGFSTMRGPYNPSINDEGGLLVEGHALRPYIGLTWNPAYYEPLLTNWGLKQARETFGYLLPLHALKTPDRIKRIVQTRMSRTKIRLRPINLKKIEAEMEIIREVYNSTLKRNWGFTPITMDDLLGAADDMKAIADPALIMIAELDGERAGVALTLPNFNELLVLTKSTPRWLRLLHIVWLMQTRKITTGRQVVYGIAPKFRNRGGLHAWLLVEQFERAQERFYEAELGWIDEDNDEISENSKMLGAVQHKRWRFYEAPL